MIVKDEAHVMARCLDSAIQFIDYWVIVDTGSNDGTQDLIRQHLARVPGELHQRPWRNFAKNRNEALDLARSKADYVLFLDADDVLNVTGDWASTRLQADAYYLRIELAGGYSFSRVNLVNARRPWRWEGAVHEVIVCAEPHQIEQLAGWTVRSLSDSARNRDPVGKFMRDAALLEAAVAEDPTHTRNVFYLAQSYRDAGELAPALNWYERRVQMGGWDEEVWYAMFQIAGLHERRSDWQRALPAYLAAYQYRPSRIEPLCELARHYRLADEHAVAYVFASAAINRPAPGDILFLDNSAYDWRALDEFAVSAYWVGKYEESLGANERLLAEGKLPDVHRERIMKNRTFCLEKLEKT